MDTTIPASVVAVMREYAQENDRRVVVGRSLVFAIILLWLLVNYGRATAMAELVTMTLFIANGIWSYAWRRWRPQDVWVPFLVVLLDCALLVTTLYSPGRIYPDSWPWPMALRLPSEAYFLVLLGLALLSFRVRLILWTGLCVLASWLLVHWLVLQTPGAIPGTGEGDGATMLAIVLDPNFVHLDALAVRGFVVALLTGLLAIAAYRLRQLLLQLAHKTRERTNLARYLAPALVDQLARTDQPLGPPREVEATVLFADIKGFTRLSQALGPAATMDLLRRYHGDMAEAVFAHGGTLDKFIGDGLMATFGAIESDPALAATERAVACARDMQARLGRWNDERRAAALPELHIGIGLHAGPVTIGDIGHANRLEFAVIGDTVNLASRIEGLTRPYDAAILASATIVERLADRDGCRSLGPVVPHGRTGEIELWRLA